MRALCQHPTKSFALVFLVAVSACGGPTNAGPDGTSSDDAGADVARIDAADVTDAASSIDARDAARDTLGDRVDVAIDALLLDSLQPDGAVDAGTPVDVPPGDDAAACGAAGMACCPGATCMDATLACDSRTGLCLSCGVNPGDPCCASSSCGSGMVCDANNLCQTCGALNQPCCAGALCSSGLSCGSTNRCAAPCGEIGQPACGGFCNTGCSGMDGTCVPVGAMCGISKYCTQTNFCVMCGSPGWGCCPGNTCGGGGCCVVSGTTSTCIATGDANPASASQVCANGAFVPCGASGQACCQDSVCANGAGCCSANGVCANANQACPGFAVGTLCSATSHGCGACGGINQPCCSGAPNHGAAGKFCTAPHSSCQPVAGGTTVCQACGAPGQPCCEANSCDAGGCCSVGGCVANGDSCGPTLGMCLDGGCQGGTCGRADYGACNSGYCTGPHTSFSGVWCNPCGGPGEACCQGWSGYVCAAGFACENATCKPCGGDLQPCCEGSLCPTSRTHTCQTYNQCY